MSGTADDAAHPVLPPFRHDFAFDRWASCIDWGCRQPTGDPVWVTPQVVTGGFATGTPAAMLRKDESNEEWLSTAGFQRLSRMLDTGCFQLGQPEHGAFLAVVW